MRYGQKITEQEFKTLKKGDKYFTADGGYVRTFDHFSKKKTLAAVSSDKMVSYLANMYWPTRAQLGLPEPVQAPVAAAPTAQPTRKENTKMSHQSTFATSACRALAVVKNDTVDAGWRTAAKQTVASTRVPLVAFLSSQRVPGMVTGLVSAALDTEYGSGALALAMGSALPLVPHFARDARFVRLAKELRVLGIETFLSNVVDQVLNPLRDQLAEIISGVPTPSDDA
jgi:uncharacterized LabA/DUF88 family protein